MRLALGDAHGTWTSFRNTKTRKRSSFFFFKSVDYFVLTLILKQCMVQYFGCIPAATMFASVRSLQALGSFAPFPNNANFKIETDAPNSNWKGCNDECLRHAVTADWNVGANFGGSADAAAARYLKHARISLSETINKTCNHASSAACSTLSSSLHLACCFFDTENRICSCDLDLGPFFLGRGWKGGADTYHATITIPYSMWHGADSSS